MTNPFFEGDPRTTATVFGDALAGLGGGGALEARRASRLQDDKQVMQYKQDREAQQGQLMAADAFQRALQQADGNPKAALKMLLTDPKFGEVVGMNPAFLPTILALGQQASAAMALPKPSSAEQRLAAAGIEPGTDAAREFLLGRPPAAPTVTIGAGDTERQKLEARRAFDPETGIAVQISDLNTQLNNTDELLRLLEQAPETGTISDAARRWVSERFGIEAGRDPRLTTLGAEITRQNNELLNQAKGPQTDQDAQRIARTRASTGSGKSANLALTITNQALVRRVRAQEQFRLDWYERNGTFAGVEEALAAKWAGRELFSPEEAARVDDLLGNADREAMKRVSDLSKALGEQNAAEVQATVEGMSDAELQALPPETLRMLETILSAP